MNRILQRQCIRDGALEGIDHGVAIGWARDRSSPDDPLAVEILCDGLPVALDRAECHRTDIPGMVGTALFCGFEIAIPRAALDSGREIAARIANTSTILPGTVRLGMSKDRGARRGLQGHVAGGDSLRLTGWVRPPGFSTAPIRIQAMLGQEVIAETFAERMKPGLLDGAADPLARGFVLMLPMCLADGRPRFVHIRDGAGRDLPGSPLLVSTHAEGADALVREVADHADLPEPTRARLSLAGEVLARRAAHVPGAADFRDLAAWRRCFPLAPRRYEGATPTVVLYGPGAADAAFLAEAGPAGPIRLLRAPDDRLPSGAVGAGPLVLWRAGDDGPADAPAHLAAALGRADAAYSDCLQEVEGRARPWFKPAWDPDMCLAQGYVFGALALSAQALLRAGVAPGMPVAEAAARVLARASRRAVRHLPELLYHQRQAPAEGAAPLPTGWAEAAMSAWPGAVLTPRPGHPGVHRVSWPAHDPLPSVAVLIPTRDRVDLLARAVDTLLGVTEYPAFIPVVLDNGTTCPDTLAYLGGLCERGVRVLPCEGPFNFSRINNLGAAAVEADLLCLLNNDVEIVSPGWLMEMVSQLMRPGIGAVGAKLLWDTGMVQHAGVVLGIDGGAAHAGPLWAAEDPGYCGVNLTVRRPSAVTAACLLVRRAEYLALGGLDETAFPVNFNDVDLCLRLREWGRDIVWTPDAVMNHHESASRGRDLLPARAARARRELDRLRARWGSVLAADPAYSPNLSRRGAPYEGLALPPAPRAPR